MVNHEFTRKVCYDVKHRNFDISTLSIGELGIIIETGSRTLRHTNMDRNKTLIPMFEQEYSRKVHQKTKKIIFYDYEPKD